MSYEYLRNVSVAILSCNRCQELYHTLESLSAGPASWREILVADNASRDGTQAMLYQRFPQVRVIEFAENQGVQGINEAYRRASGRWILSLDDDSAPAMETWAPLCRVLCQDWSYAAIALSVRRTAHSQGGVDPPEPILKPAYGFSQAGTLFSREAIRSLGGFDEELFLWAVELHWAARALLRGMSLARCDSAVVVHRSAPANRSSRRHAFHYCRNLFLFILRYVPEGEKRRRIGRFLTDVMTYTMLHHTYAYLQGIGSALRIERSDSRLRKHRRRLSSNDLKNLQPDWRAPFAYMG